MARSAYLIASNQFGPDSGLHPLLGPVNDVENLEKQLSNPQRGDFTVSRFINEDWGAIRKKLYSEIKQKDPEDVVLVYFSGHGLIDDDDGRLYLSSVESLSSNVAGTSLLASELLDRLKRSPARQCVFILDCCYSGAVGDISGKAGGASPARVNLEGISRGTGVTVLTASTDTQTAKDIETERVGLFTKYLVEGLESGKADKDRDGIITAREIFDYASQKPKRKPNIDKSPR